MVSNDMKKFFIKIFIFFVFFISYKSFSLAQEPIVEYLKKKNIDESETQVYLLNRCSAVYAYASAILMKSDVLTSKKFIDTSNQLLFKSTELLVIDKKMKLEEAQKKVEKVRDDLFEKYINSGKDNWKKNKSHFKGSYIAIDMGICGKLVEGQLNQTQ